MHSEDIPTPQVLESEVFSDKKAKEEKKDKKEKPRKQL